MGGAPSLSQFHTDITPSLSLTLVSLCVTDFWFKSVALHARDPKDGSLAPVFLVGTHKDKVPDPSDHEHISKILHEKFGHWPSLQRFDSAILTTGRGTLWCLCVCIVSALCL